MPLWAVSKSVSYFKLDVWINYESQVKFKDLPDEIKISETTTTTINQQVSIGTWKQVKSGSTISVCLTLKIPIEYNRMHYKWNVMKEVPSRD